MFVKIVKYGISPQILNLLHSLYSATLTCVKVENSVTSFFESTLSWSATRLQSEPNIFSTYF